jgi:hypothetical protein
MEGGEVGGSAGIFTKLYCEDGPGVSGGLAGLFRDTDRLRASQIDAFAADLMHQWRALLVRTGAVRHRADKAPGVGVYIRLDGRHAVNLAPAIG